MYSNLGLSQFHRKSKVSKYSRIPNSSFSLQLIFGKIFQPPSLFLRHPSLLQLSFHDIKFQDFGFLRVAVVSLFSLTIYSFVLSFQPILGHYLTNGTFFATMFIFIMLCY